MAGLHQWPQLSAASESHPHHEPAILPLAFWFPELSVSPPGSLPPALTPSLFLSLDHTHREGCPQSMDSCCQPLSSWLREIAREESLNCVPWRVADPQKGK